MTNTAESPPPARVDIERRRANTRSTQWRGAKAMFAEFDLLTPAAIGEALAALAKVKSERDCVPLGGGTNLVVDMRARRSSHDALISVGQLPGMADIMLGGGRISMGGAVTVSQILRHPERRHFGGALIDAAHVFAGQMVRNTATVAGNICCGSPAADLVPPLLALDAAVTLECSEGRRDVSLSDYFLGYKSSVRKPNELLTRITWPEPRSRSDSAFYKLARRKGDAITVVGVAVALTVEEGKCARARIALGAVAPVAKRARRAEEMLEGRTLSAGVIEAAAQAAMDESSPIDDVRATAAYRKHQVRVLVRRLLTQAWQRLS
ncbi:MAG: xanthine dehydrogenase family protein subunit M [Hyphomicrobiaceae bacterium]|nr:MAG: xanthine dehydrogenase family protein subunit M [Hyphomicrobiaceae bacterium]